MPLERETNTEVYMVASHFYKEIPQQRFIKSGLIHGIMRSTLEHAG